MTTWTALLDAGHAAGQLSLQAAVVVVAIVAVQRAARRWLSPQWRYALWTVLLLRLVAVGAVPAAFSIHNATEWAAETSTSLSPVATPAGSVFPGAPTNVSDVSGPEALTRPLLSPMAAFAPDAVALSWMLGMLVLGAIVLFQSRRMARAVARGELVTDSATLNLLESCRKALRLRTWLALVETEAVKSPTLMGALRPKLLLPKGLLANVREEQLRHVFLHELMHYKRGDIWTGWLVSLLLVVHWFNPVLWWARSRILVDRECACDAAVLATLAGGERAAYGETMIDLAERLATPPRWAPGMAGILETSTNLNRRIDMIVMYKPRTRTASLLGIALMLVLGAVGLTNARADDAILSSEKAELMGRVENFFWQNPKDVTSRQPLEWGDVETAADGTRSIRYMCEARIWDKKTMILNMIFTFKPNGEIVRVDKVEGYPKEKEAKAADTSSKEGLQALVEDFFKRNFRDVTARKTIEWGEPETQKDGNRAIRYKYEAKIWDKETIVNDQVFTFKPDGEFVRVEKVGEAPKKTN